MDSEVGQRQKDNEERGGEVVLDGATGNSCEKQGGINMKG